MDRSRCNRLVSQSQRQPAPGAPIHLLPAAVARGLASDTRKQPPSCTHWARASVRPAFTRKPLVTKSKADGIALGQLQGRLLDEPPAITPYHRNLRPLPGGNQFAVRKNSAVVCPARAPGSNSRPAQSLPRAVPNLPPRPHKVMEKREGGDKVL